jgi:hypothetical protein
MNPAFLITIDAEGDNLWSRPQNITTENARFLDRFQKLCERFELKPTWLTNYEMATSHIYRKFAKDVVRRGTAEIGMHLHAWNSPPLFDLTGDDNRHHPYLTEYPSEVIRDKVTFITNLLSNVFESAVTSHRSGRWALNRSYAGVLKDNGYFVDCSVTPWLSWRDVLGDPKGRGGSDYTLALDQPHLLDTGKDRPGLLELPMSITPPRSAIFRKIRHATRNRSGRLGRICRRLAPVQWLRPRQGNLKGMLGVLRDAVRDRRPYLMFMLHSSEMMPGGSPTFPDAASIETLYADLEVLFKTVRQSFRGSTLTEYARTLETVSLPTRDYS